MLVRHPETGKLFINFDPSFIELLRETEIFRKIGIDLPTTSDDVVVNINEIKNRLFCLSFGTFRVLVIFGIGNLCDSKLHSFEN